MHHMGRFDDHVATIGDWMLPNPNPSPKSFFSSMTGTENKDGLTSSVDAARNSDKDDPCQTDLGDYDAPNTNVLCGQNLSSRGGLMDRIAARAGFSAPPLLNTQNLRAAVLSKNSEAQSPLLTISPGLSPTTLLDSPVFVTNSMLQPSPTTGKFPFSLNGISRNPMLMAGNADKGKENTFADSSSFSFKPTAESSSIPHFNATTKVMHSSGFSPLSFPGVGVSFSSNTSLGQQIESTKLQNFSESQAEADKHRVSSVSLEHSYSVGAAGNSPLISESHEDDVDRRSSGNPNVGSSEAEDGYNWRKYGQKQVKGSEFPRSYYKCTHPNCLVKKKVERSHEGHITEIIYKGAHNHPKPQPNRRSSLGSSNAPDEMQQQLELEDANCDLTWSSMHGGNVTGGPDWSQENLEATSRAPQVNEYSNVVAMQAQNGSQYETGDGADGYCTYSNDDDDDERATHGSLSLDNDGEGDESEPKRRRIEAYASEISGATRAIREPRVVVQTTSEVDILDDGYRWRKYGQKVVKGNPNPRSYYKCTSAGCNVRKHVERASHDLKSVITTYEGKHNHDVPAARNSSHVNSGSGGQQASVSTNMYRTDRSKIQRGIPQFDRPPFSTFGLPGRPPHLGPGPGFGFGINPGMGFGGLGHSQGKFPMLPVHPYLLSRPMNDMGLMLPKAEPKLEPVTESSDYHQLMNQLPLGPHI